MVERQPPIGRCDGLQRSFEPRRLDVRKSHLGDDSAKLGDGGVADRLPTAVAHEQRFESGLRNLATGAYPEDSHDELAHRIEQQPRPLRAEAMPQPSVDLRQNLPAIVESENELHGDPGSHAYRNISRT